MLKNNFWTCSKIISTYLLKIIPFPWFTSFVHVKILISPLNLIQHLFLTILPPFGNSHPRQNWTWRLRISTKPDVLLPRRKPPEWNPRRLHRRIWYTTGYHGLDQIELEINYYSLLTGWKWGGKIIPVKGE